MAKVRHGKSEEFALDENQLQALWNQCREIEDKVLIGLLAFCGMRVSEAIHLKITWIRQEEINIPSSMACKCWECRGRGYWKPKSKAGIRSIPIPGFLQPILAEYLGKRPEGLKITRQSAWNRVRSLCRAASIPIIFPHALRASYATMLASHNLTGTELCFIMGWSRLTVGEAYVRIAEARKGATQKIRQIWG